MKKNCISCKEYLHCKRPQKGLTVHDCSYFNEGFSPVNDKKNEETFCHHGSICIKPSLNLKKEHLVFDVEEKINDMVVNHYKEVVNFKDKAVKDALIALGWTPPEENTVCSNEMQMPNDFTCVWEKEVSSNLDVSSKGKKETEKLFELKEA